MSQIFKAFLGIFLILLFVITMIGVITADQDISNARDFKNQVVTQIEVSNFSSQVINACKSSATDYGYELDTNTILDTNNRAVAVEITLRYNYSIPFLNVFSNHTLHDYAR